MELGHVRVHNDAVAQRAAAGFDARALTVGHHIVLGSARVDDETMFHELDHVRQQAQGQVAGRDNGSGVKVSHEHDPFERQSAANGRRVAQGSPPDLSLPGGAGHGAPVQRASVQRAPVADGRVTKAKGRGKAKKQESARDVAEAVTKELQTKYDWDVRGGQQDRTLHFPLMSDNPPAYASSEGLLATELGKTYHGSGSNIRPERSFEPDRVEQALRWISTVVFNYLNDHGKEPVEVQTGVATVDSDEAVEPNAAPAKKYELYISSNKDAANKALSDLYEGKSNARAFLTEILTSNKANADARTPREKRHAEKVSRRLLESREGMERYGEVLQALAGPVRVPGKREDPKEDGMHAERRIMESAPQGSIANNRIAGVKRPCMVCYMELFAGDDTKRPGPFWPSRSSSIGIDNYTVAGAAALAASIHEAAQKAGGTHVTLRVDCEGKERLETGYGTDSDSPASGSDRQSSPEAMDTTP
ncbi:DUF4157 domain-containing protein [Streptomyces lomondensis]|nr:DUF4157 domain-containing protein [Streptomyces lomondensis]